MRERLPAIIRTIESMGYGVSGEIPKTLAGVGCERKTIAWTGQNAFCFHPGAVCPTPLWAFMYPDLLGSADAMEVMRTLLALGADPSLGSVQQSDQPLGLLAQLNQCMQIHLGPTAHMEALFVLFVNEGLDPLQALPTPNWKDVHPGVVRELVRASFERQILLQSCAPSEADLREAMELLRQKRAAEQALSTAGTGAAPKEEGAKTPGDTRDAHAPRRSLRL